MTKGRQTSAWIATARKTLLQEPNITGAALAAVIGCSEANAAVIARRLREELGLPLPSRGRGNGRVARPLPVEAAPEPPEAPPLPPTPVSAPRAVRPAAPAEPPTDPFKVELVLSRARALIRASTSTDAAQRAWLAAEVARECPGPLPAQFPSKQGRPRGTGKRAAAEETLSDETGEDDE